MTLNSFQEFKISLISPPYDIKKIYSHWSFAAPIEPPLGLAYIAGMLRAKGFDVQLIDSTALGYDINDLGDLLTKRHPHVVGISANSPVYPISLQVANMVKRLLPSTTVVLGGCHPTWFPERVIKKECVDVVVVGEGEVAMFEICSALAVKGELNGIKGIVYKKDERVVMEEERPLLENLDVLPVPSYDLLPIKKYRLALGLSNKVPVANMVTSRGCTKRCKFCTAPGLWRGRWRAHSSQYVADLAEMLVRRYRVRHIHFRDDHFSVSRERVYEICEEFVRRQLRISWDAYSTVSAIEKDLVKKMKEAGCTCLSMGVESGNDEIMRKFKGISKEDVFQKVKMLRSAGMRFRLFFMLAPPAQKREHLQETLDFALEIKPDFILFLPTIPLPGSRLYQECLDLGVEIPDYDNEVYNYQRVLYAPSPFTKQELEDFMRTCYRRSFLRPSYFMKLFPKVMNIHSLKRILEGLRYLPGYFLGNRGNENTSG